MRPKDLGFEDCDIIPYCRITEPNTQCDSQNCNRNSKTASKLPIPGDVDTDELVVKIHSNNKTEQNAEKETSQKPENCKDFESLPETKSTSKGCDRYSFSSQKGSFENISITESNNSENSVKECKVKYSHNNLDNNSTNSTSSALSLPSNEKNCRERLNKNKTEILKTTCNIPLPEKPTSVNSGKNYCNILNDEKGEVNCSKHFISDYSDSCSSICPYFKYTKKSCLPNLCNDCQKYYESILCSINSIKEKSSKYSIKNKQPFEDNKKIGHDTEGDQLCQLEVEERRVSYEELSQGKSNTKCPITEKTCNNFGANLSSQTKINKSFCNDPSKTNDLEKDVLDENLTQSINDFESCSDYSSKKQDSREDYSEEHPNKLAVKKKCDCVDRKYCKIDSKCKKYTDKEVDSSDKSNISSNTSETIFNCPWKQVFEDFCKENEKFNQLEKNRNCSEKYLPNNKLESELNPPNPNKNIIKQEEVIEKQLSESLKQKNCACRRAKKKKDLQELYKVASNKQTKKKKCCCKRKNNNNQEKKYCTEGPTDPNLNATCDIDLCGKKTFIECPRKKQSFEEFCKEKRKLSEVTDDTCSNRQNRCGKIPQDVENKLSFKNAFVNSELGFNSSLSNSENNLMESIRDFELGSDSSSNALSLNASILLLNTRKLYLQEYLEDGENRPILCSSVSNKIYPESISHIYSQSSLSTEIKFSRLCHKSFHSDNYIKCITKNLDKGNKQVSTESVRENNTSETKLCGKWSLYLLQIQNETDEELCRQYDEYLRQEEEFSKAKCNTLSDQSISLPQSDFLFNMNSTNSSSESIQNLSLKIEIENLPSSIPVIGEGPFKSNNKYIKISNNCLSMPLGSGNTNNSANKNFTLESFQSTMESEAGTKKCFMNPIKLQLISEEKKDTEPSGSAEICCKNEDSTCKVTINRSNTSEENDLKLSLNVDKSTKERSIILSSQISSLDKEGFKAFSDAHEHTMATIKYAMQDLADTIYKNTSKVALSAVTRLQSETAKPIEIIKNYSQSEASSQIKKYIDENAENKLKIIMSKINGGNEGEAPFYKKIYVKANEVLKSTLSYVGDSTLGKITLPNFNDESSIYDVPVCNIDSKSSKVQDVAHVVSSNPLTDMFGTIKAKFWTLFSTTEEREENITFKVSETSIYSNLSESDTESDEDVD